LREHRAKVDGRPAAPFIMSDLLVEAFRAKVGHNNVILERREVAPLGG
jgi:hypothetical protein